MLVRILWIVALLGFFNYSTFAAEQDEASREEVAAQSAVTEPSARWVQCTACADPIANVFRNPEGLPCQQENLAFAFCSSKGCFKKYLLDFKDFCEECESKAYVRRSRGGTIQLCHFCLQKALLRAAHLEFRQQIFAAIIFSPWLKEAELSCLNLVQTKEALLIYYSHLPERKKQQAGVVQLRTINRELNSIPAQEERPRLALLELERALWQQLTEIAQDLGEISAKNLWQSESPTDPEEAHSSLASWQNLFHEES